MTVGRGNRRERGGKVSETEERISDGDDDTREGKYKGRDQVEERD